MIKKYYSDIDVVTAARQRVINIFRTAPKVSLQISGGKDSIVLNDIVFKLCSSGEVDKSKLVVDFVDEEAIYPCIEQIVKKMRMQWLSIGVEFCWWCIEVRHYNCFNALTSDESFICWDRYKENVWVRPKPKFAISEHPLLNKRSDTYQMFIERMRKDSIQISGVRCSESLQRVSAIAKKKTFNKLYPIYDMNDKDVWRYILENNCDLPDAYLFLYQTGASLNRLRLSQFFSIDTAGPLVSMCEYYPELFDRICKREPNAYMAMLYYDTEMFRRQKERGQLQKNKDIDYKAKVLELLYNDDFFQSDSAKKMQGRIKQTVMVHGSMISNLNYKRIYNTLIGGDPKLRSCRAILMDIFANTGKDLMNV